MIRINQSDIGLIKLYKGNELLNIAAVYYKGELIWPIFNDIQACFSGGYWIDDLPWLDELPWQD